jgi:hypothetical protein
MQNKILEWAMGIILKTLESYLTAEKINEFKVQFITMLRTESKLLTPDFPYDDEAVEVLAKALQVA